MKILFVLGFTLFAFGCGLIVQPKYIVATPVDDTKYANWDCFKLADQARHVDDLLKLGEATYETIAMMTGMGMTMDIPLTKEIARLKGEQIAINNFLNKCPMR